ncbi:MAG: hypothetical protein KDA60_01085 [Planctomycetales bacterium]|nr:hypothetical protein [Planctomycetales bacterium]
MVYPVFQKAILKRVFVYWLFCMLYITIPITIINSMSMWDLSFPEQLRALWSKYWLVFTLASLLLPLALLDALRLSHSFVGPIYRLRLELERYAKHPEVSFSKYRETDFWDGLAADVKNIEKEFLNFDIDAPENQHASVS